MYVEEREKTWVQCTNCGHIYTIDDIIPMEKAIINSTCRKCEHERALNCGYSETDCEELKDPYLDCRYFMY